MSAVLQNRWRYTETSNTPTTWTTSLTSPSPTSGRFLVLHYSKDGSGTTSGITAGWSSVVQAADGTSTVCGGSSWKESAGSESSVVLTFGAGEHGEVVVEEWSGIASGSTPVNPACATGNSANADPPASGTVTSADYAVSVACAIDTTVVATAAPSGYGDLQTYGAGATSSAALSTANKTSTGTVTSENPGAFTSTSEQWVAMTVLLMIGTSTTNAVWTAAAAAAAAWTGRKTAAAVLTSAATSTASWVGRKTAAAVWSAAATSAITWRYATTLAAVWSAAGIAALAGVGRSTKAAVFTSAAAASNLWVGRSTRAAVLTVASAAVVIWQGSGGAVVRVLRGRLARGRDRIRGRRG